MFLKNKLDFFAHENIKKNTQKSSINSSRIFCRFRNFPLLPNSPTAQIAEFMFPNVAYRATVYRNGVFY